MTVTNPASDQLVGPGRHEQLSEKVARQVREAIMVGELVAPTYIRTEHLAADYGVSASPVREALMILQTEGAVRWHPRKGYQVNPVTARDVQDLFDVQAYIAGELAARAAEVLTPAQLDRLDAIQAELESAQAAGDLARVERLNHEVHRTINRASRSTRMAAMLQQTVQYVPRGFYSRIAGWSDASAHEHGAILAALRNRDADGARKAMAEHIRSIGTLLLSYLERQHTLSPEELPAT
jgi:DNA-binding GntR family transcriptional regulator